MLDLLKIWLPVVVLSVAAFALTYQFVDPSPPDRVVIATGSPEGAYFRNAERYREILAKDGITVEILTTAGSSENLDLLEPGCGTDAVSGEAVAKSAARKADLAFVQGGVGNPENCPSLRGLASVYFEPLWVFVRGRPEVQRLSDLAGSRLGVGPEGSGTNHLASVLLEVNGVTRENSRYAEIPSANAAQALLDGGIDAAFFVTASPNETMRPLLRDPNVRLLEFDRAGAYERWFRYLSTVTLPRGALDLENDIPARDLTMVAPAATLVAHEDLHPALIDLLMRAAKQVHARGSMFEGRDQFPAAAFLDFPVSTEAARILRSGPGFLRSYVPFWAANLIERLAIMLLPLITLMIPLMRIAPPAYRWQVRRRIYRWYDRLRAIEARASNAADPEAAATFTKELDDLQDEIGSLKVPLAYAENLYHLRQHIAFVRGLVAHGHQAPAAPLDSGLAPATLAMGKLSRKQAPPETGA